MNHETTLLMAKFDAQNIEIRQKGNWHWYHLFVPAFFWCVGLFRPIVKKKFYKSYFTTLGSTIYVPDLIDFYANIDSKYSVLRHEYVHILDYRRQPIRYNLGYVLSRSARAYLERRGYAQNMIVQFERSGYVSDDMVDWVTDKFTGAMYFHMDPDAKEKILEMRRKIYSGEYRGEYPDVK